MGWIWILVYCWWCCRYSHSQRSSNRSIYSIWCWYREAYRTLCWYCNCYYSVWYCIRESNSRLCWRYCSVYSIWICCREGKQRRSWIWFPIHYRWSCRIQDQQSTRKYRHLCCWWKQSRILYSSNRSWIWFSLLCWWTCRKLHRQRSSNWSLYDQWSGCIQLCRQLCWFWISIHCWRSSRIEDHQQTRKHSSVCCIWNWSRSCYSQRSICRWNFIYLLWSSSYRKSCSCRRRYNTIHLQWCSRVRLQSQISWFWYYQSTQWCCRKQDCRSTRIYRTIQVLGKQSRILYSSDRNRIWFLWWILWNESFRETYRSILRNHTTICR